MTDITKLTDEQLLESFGDTHLIGQKTQSYQDVRREILRRMGRVLKPPFDAATQDRRRKQWGLW